MMMVLGYPAGKVVAFIMKVQLQFQMLRQISFEGDRREMLDVGTIVMKLWIMSTLRQPPLVLIADHHSRMVRHMPNQAWSDRPQERVSFSKRLVETPNSGASS